MQYFISKIIFRIICGDGTHTAQFDEQVRLVHANNREEAYHKSVEIGKQEEATFLNEQGLPVKWQFINIAELYNLDVLTDGIEVCSRVHEADHSDNYIQFVNNKADHIRSALKSRKQEPA